jgi:SPP1 gp7 family putative phage head morphogenesis protein
MGTAVFTKPSAEYWRDRALEAEALANANALKTSKELAKLFTGVQAEMDAEIKGFYDKYGKVISSPVFSTLPDGSQVVTGATDKLVVSPQDAYKAGRYEKLNAKLNDHLKGLGKSQNKEIESSLSLTAQDSYLRSLYAIQTGTTVGSSFTVLPKTTINALINNEVNGANFSERVWDNTEKLSKVVNQTLKSGITQGLSVRDMSKRVASDMESGYKVAERVIRTETNNTYNQGTKEGYVKSKLIERYEYLATLDSKTSEVCQELDGKKFKVEDAITGLNYPPMHPNCSSSTVPVIDLLDDMDEGTRAAREVDGTTYQVPASMNYKYWEKVFVDKSMTLAEWTAAQSPASLATPVPLFVPAKTLLEATQKGYEFANAVDMKGLPLSVINTMNQTMETLKAKYPIDYLSKYGSFTGKSAAHANFKIIEVAKGFAKDPADYFKGSLGNNFRKRIDGEIARYQKMIDDMLAANPNFGTVPYEKAIESLEKRKLFSRHNVVYAGTEVRDVVNHEYGHVLADQYFNQINLRGDTDPTKKASRQLVDKIFKQAKSSGDIHLVSEYAAKDSAEFFAEVFAMREAGVEKIPDYFNKMLEEVLKK